MNPSSALAILSFDRIAGDLQRSSGQGSTSDDLQIGWITADSMDRRSLAVQGLRADLVRGQAKLDVDGRIRLLLNLHCFLLGN